MTFARGNAVWRVSLQEVEVESMGSRKTPVLSTQPLLPNLSAVEPRPWRMIMLWRCSSLGRKVMGSGYLGWMDEDALFLSIFPEAILAVC